MKLKKGKLEQDKRTNHFKTNNITVTTEDPISYKVDGETIENTKFEIKILPKAIKIYHNVELESKFLSV